jgi:2-phosphosulfolactate phosphatase
VNVAVLFGVAGIAPADVAGRVVLVVDVLRASTTIATALANGARAILPFENSEDAVARLRHYERAEVRLAGERRMLPIPGFDLGNSPLEFTREAVEGKTLLMSTSNGTSAIAGTQGASDVVVGSYVNFSATLSILRTALRGGVDVAIICAGSDRRFSLEDAACAGRYVQHLAKRAAHMTLNDGAQACNLINRKFGDDLMALFEASEHGRALRAAGYADDLAACAAIDAQPVVPVYQERQITRLGPDRER